jgi:hypothetical protein
MKQRIKKKIESLSVVVASQAIKKQIVSGEDEVSRNIGNTVYYTP